MDLEVITIPIVEPPIKDPLRKGQPVTYRTLFKVNLREEDNLLTKDNMAGPKVSFIRRLHCKVECRPGIVESK